MKRLIVLVILLIASTAGAYCSTYYFSHEYQPTQGSNKICVYEGVSGEMHLPFPVFQLCPLSIKYDEYWGMCSNY
ncbi:hypothetical protein KAR91_51240 [Candidatus Pacearchaeota archaeon]|nr:hypothetical protein [Candidatus Pacearchaeota archaeon]